MTRPLARTSQDCENAVAALVALNGDAACGLRGTYEGAQLGSQMGTVWPGDAITIGARTAVIRDVVMTDTNCAPELIRYSLRFANEWAEPVALATREGLPDDVVLPIAIGATPTLASLASMTIVSVSATAITLDAGVDAPTGGGFEVRRWDGGFGVAASDPDLVLRSPVRTFDIPRGTQVEAFFVRMYDGATPRKYSRWSSEVRVSVPV